MDKHKLDPLFQVLYTLVVAAVFFAFGYFFNAIFNVENPSEPPMTLSEVFMTTTTATTTTTTNTTTTTTSTTVTTRKSGKSQPTVSYPLSINTATKEELMTIKGIGESYAQRIIDYRKKIGGFTELDQLLEIKGIGEKRLAQWKPYLKL